jgi:hypothetical protein
VKTINILLLSCIASCLIHAQDLRWVDQAAWIEPECMTIDDSANVYTAGRLRGTNDCDPSSGTFLLRGLLKFNSL